jgi:hypothetical protein
MKTIGCDSEAGAAEPCLESAAVRARSAFSAFWRATRAAWASRPVNESNRSDPGSKWIAGGTVASTCSGPLSSAARHR